MQAGLGLPGSLSLLSLQPQLSAPGPDPESLRQADVCFQPGSWDVTQITALAKHLKTHTKQFAERKAPAASKAPPMPVLLTHQTAAQIPSHSPHTCSEQGQGHKLTKSTSTGTRIPAHPLLNGTTHLQKRPSQLKPVPPHSKVLWKRRVGYLCCRAAQTSSCHSLPPAAAGKPFPAPSGPGTGSPLAPAASHGGIPASSALPVPRRTQMLLSPTTM